MTTFPTICPVDDHDGAQVPVTRHIEAYRIGPVGTTRTDAGRCDYCGEGEVARLIRHGYRVTVWAVQGSRPTWARLPQGESDGDRYEDWDLNGPAHVREDPQPTDQERA